MLFLIIGIYNIDYINLTKKGNYRFVFESDKDNVFENLIYVKKIKGEAEFNKLIKQFLADENGDLLTKQAAIRFIFENRRVEFLDDLILVQKNFETISPDSTWVIQIEQGRFREGGLKDAAIIPYLNETIIELSNYGNAIDLSQRR